RLRAPAHFDGGLVVAEAEEDGVAQAAVARLLHEADLPDQRRLEPRRVPHPWRVEEGRCRAPQRREPLRELGERLAREAGADLALAAALARRLERLEAVASEPSRQAQRAGGAHFFFEHRAPLGQGVRAEIAPAREETVENDVDRPAPRVGAEELKARDSLGIE